jgi:hypothetical protein
VDAEAEQPRGRVKGVAEVAAVRAAFLPPSPSACVEDRFITGRLANKSFVPALNPTARFGVEAHTAASIRRAQPQLSPTASWRLGPMATPNAAASHQKYPSPPCPSCTSTLMRLDHIHVRP